jgi:excisionase family DNA binding protein
MPESDPEYLTVKAACELLGVSPNTLRSWGAAGKVTEYRHPMNNYRLFRRSDLEELKNRLTHPETRPTSNRQTR